jgi:hypothetical protein
VTSRSSTADGTNLAHCNDPNCEGGDESISTFTGPWQSSGRLDLVLDASGHPVFVHYAGQSDGR